MLKVQTYYLSFLLISIFQLRFGSEYHFYMETQTALAIPDEDNCMVVYTSSQCPENSQSVIASCLGVPAHNIRVITRRLGGAFGGKFVKAMPVSIRKRNGNNNNFLILMLKFMNNSRFPQPVH